MVEPRKVLCPPMQTDAAPHPRSRSAFEAEKAERRRSRPCRPTPDAPFLNGFPRKRRPSGWSTPEGKDSGTGCSDPWRRRSSSRLPLDIVDHSWPILAAVWCEVAKPFEWASAPGGRRPSPRPTSIIIGARTVRIHIPVVTNPGVEFNRGRAETRHLAAGESGLSPTAFRKPTLRCPIAATSVAFLHLVLDKRSARERLWDLVRHGDVRCICRAQLPS
jgi:hypothetical protein